MPIKRRVAGHTTIGLPVRLPDGRRHRFHVSELTDLAVIADVLGGDQYATPVLADPKVIVDAGAHIGATAIYYATRYPCARIEAIEASPTTFRRLLRNTASLPNIRCHNLALTSHDGQVVFHEASEAWASSLHGTGDALNVQGITLHSFLDNVGAERVDLLKLDIEGAEYDVLRTAPWERIAAVVGEMHHWLPGVAFTEADVLGLLTAYDVEVDTSGRDYLFRAT
jgi:FkbM family methyltransferase